MPAKSKTQQRFFGMVHALQSGHLDMSKMPEELKSKLEKTAASISKKGATDFASNKVTESIPMTFKDYMTLEAIASDYIKE